MAKRNKALSLKLKTVIPKIEGKKKKSKRKKAPTATQKLRKNVQATIRRAEKRGIRFSDAFKKLISKAKYQTLKSLQRNKYEKLYSQGTALSPTGEIISGTQARVLIRRESAKKAAETRRVNKLLATTTAEGERAERLLSQTQQTQPQYENDPETFDNEPDFEEQERKRQKEFITKLKNDPDFQASVSIGSIMYENVRATIKEYENLGAGEFGKYFTAKIDTFLDQYDLQVLLAGFTAIGFDEFDEASKDILYYSGNIENLRSALERFDNLIDKAILYSGYTSDFQWDKTKEEMMAIDSDTFSQEAYRR